MPQNAILALEDGTVFHGLAFGSSRDAGGEIYILLKEKANLVEGEIIGAMAGKDLEGMKYEGMFDKFSGVKEHKVISWKEVTEEEGTGIVHIAPGCGSDDFQLSKELKLPVIDLTNNDSEYREEFGELADKFVGSEEVREWIFQNLESRGFVYKIEDYTHRYPTCWRCKTELIFRLVDEWYISMDKLRALLMETTKKIKWIPPFGLDRELDWLKNMQDWLISKKRYWGLALPIYECEKCTPVTQTKSPRGISTSILFRLCSVAPIILSFFCLV